jgi:hypothetical protein
MCLSIWLYVCIYIKLNLSHELLQLKPKNSCIVVKSYNKVHVVNYMFTFFLETILLDSIHDPLPSSWLICIHACYTCMHRQMLHWEYPWPSLGLVSLCLSLSLLISLLLCILPVASDKGRHIQITSYWSFGLAQAPELEVTSSRYRHCLLIFLLLWLLFRDLMPQVPNFMKVTEFPFWNLNLVFTGCCWPFTVLRVLQKVI